MIQLITPKDQPTSESGDTITASPWERCEVTHSAYILLLPRSARGMSRERESECGV